jgi:hypothetical protein
MKYTKYTKEEIRKSMSYGFFRVFPVFRGFIAFLSLSSPR